MSPRADRRRVVLVAAVLAAAAVALLIVRERWWFPIGYRLTGNEISNAGLAVQLAALVAGVALLHRVRGPAVPWVLIAEGAACLLAHGAAGVAFALALLAWWSAMNAAWLGRGRAVVAVVLVAAVNACAWSTDEVASAALLFSMMFGMRLIVFAYDRWQHDFERVPLRDFLVFVLPAPLVILPPYFAIIPMFGGFADRVRPDLSAARLRACGRHFAWAALFGALRGAMGLAGLGADDLVPPAWACWKFVANVLDVATLAHVLIPLLLLHGIEERLPLLRPLFATRIVQFWQRFGVHQKDAQVFLFYTPALLRLRRGNRYLAIVLATIWTLVVGNTLLHLAIRTCFLPDTWDRLGWALAANAVMGAALAADLCYEEWWSRRGARPPRTVPRLAIGWVLTMTVAVVTGVL